MSDLQRWSLGWNKEGVYQRHDSDGHWVEHEQAADLIEQLQQRNAELSATVERLREHILSLQVTDDGVAGKGYNKGLQDAAGVFETVTNQANLNHVKREVAKSAYNQAIMDSQPTPHEDDALELADKWSDEYINEQYPSDKE